MTPQQLAIEKSRDPYRADGQLALCKGCEHMIRWLTTEKGKSVPVAPFPLPGNWGGPLWGYGPERTDGELTAQLFPNMQLGGASENVDQVSSGAIMGTWIGVSYLSRIVPELEALSLPFVFDNREEAFALIDGEIGDLLDEKLAAALV